MWCGKFLSSWTRNDIRSWQKILFRKKEKTWWIKRFPFVEIIIILVILASIAIPYTLGYIEDSKNSKDHLMARHILKAVQVMGTKYYHLGDYYQDKANESVSNVVSAQVETMNMSKE